MIVITMGVIETKKGLLKPFPKLKFQPHHKGCGFFDTIKEPNPGKEAPK